MTSPRASSMRYTPGLCVRCASTAEGSNAAGVAPPSCAAGGVSVPFTANPSVVRAQAPGDQQRDLHGLLVVQPRVHLRFVCARENGLAQPARAADALGHVVARELEMYAAEVAALLLVD